MALTLTSPAFTQGDPIPAIYSCEGEDRTPELAWSGAPPETQSYALIMDDPDAPAGTWVHWVVANIPANIQAFPDNMTTLPSGAVFGANSWGKQEYGGPCPPGGTHRYFFKLYALDSVLPTSEGVDKASLEAAMKDHILANAELMGTYSR